MPTGSNWVSHSIPIAGPPPAAPTLGAPTSPSAPTPHQPHCQHRPFPHKTPPQLPHPLQSHHAIPSKSPSEKARAFIHRLQAMAAIRPIRNRNRFLSWSAPDPLSTAQTSLPSSLSTITTRLHDPVSHVRIPSRLHSIPTPTPISLRLDLFGRLIARPRNVHVHSEAVHVHVHDDAACTCTSTCTWGLPIHRSRFQQLPWSSESV